MFSLDQIIEWLLVYKYVMLFPIAAIEGPIISIIVGFLSFLDLINIYIAYFVIVVADISSDIGYYFMGKWGGKKYIDKWGKYIGLEQEKLIKVESYFRKHRKKTLLFGKLTHAIGAPILFTAGLTRIPLWEFIWINLLGTLPKSFFFLFIGYHFGQAYVKFDKYLDYFTVTVLGLGLITFLIYYLYIRYKHKYLGFIEKLKRKNFLKLK